MLLPAMTTSPSDSPMPETLGGRYRVVGKLGEGGMGTVYRAVNDFTGREVAIKTLRAEIAHDAVLTQRFLREARAATAVGHPLIVEVLDGGHDAATGCLFLVQELLEGRDLRAYLEEKGPLPLARALALLVPLCGALSAAHARGIVHRDLKPENVFVTRAASGELEPKLIDFGIAKVLGTPELRLTSTGAAMGTPYYMSPEQCRGDAELDARTDVWSLAVMTYELLTGAVPFEASNYNLLVLAVLTEEPRPFAPLAPSVDPRVETVLARALRKKPAERTPSVAAFLEDLLACVSPEQAATLRERNRRFLPAQGVSASTPPGPLPPPAPVETAVTQVARAPLTKTPEPPPPAPPAKRRSPPVVAGAARRRPVLALGAGSLLRARAPSPAAPSPAPRVALAVAPPAPPATPPSAPPATPPPSPPPSPVAPPSPPPVLARTPEPAPRTPLRRTTTGRPARGREGTGTDLPPVE